MILLYSAFLFVLGACLGSFVAACAWRIPRDISILYPPSCCPQCSTPLAWYVNIPLLGYLVCRRRCIYCYQPISSRYFLIELFLALLFVAVGLANVGDVQQTVWYLVFVFFLFASGVVDLISAVDHGEAEGIIPDIFSIGGLLSALLLSLWMGTLPQAVLGAISGGGVLFLVYLFYLKVRRIEALGLGDVKMLAMIGAFVGISGVLYSLFLASLSGLLAALVTMAWRRNFSLQMKIPFGPFLALGALLFLVIRG